MLLRLSDWAFIGLGVSLLFLDTSIDGLIALTGLLPLLWVGMQSAVTNLSRSYILSAVFLLQLGVILVLVSGLNPPPLGMITREEAATPTFWATTVALGVLILARLAIVPNIARLTDDLLPWVLLACFIGLTVAKFTSFGGLDCRVRGLTNWPFTPALFFTTFTLLAFVSWPRLDARGQYFRLGLVAAAVVVANGYAGTRMIALVQFVCFLGLAGLFAWVRPPGLTRPALRLLGAVGVGVGLSVVVDIVTGCQLILRFGEIATAAMDTASLSDGSSLALRLQFLDQAFGAVAAAPWFGYGIWAEQMLVDGSGHNHVHNQYLSWLIWGGVPVLISGIMFLVAPLFAISGVTDRWRRTVLTAAIVGPMPLSLAADTFLRLPTFLNLHLFVAALVIAVAVDPRRDAGLSVKRTDRPEAWTPKPNKGLQEL